MTTVMAMDSGQTGTRIQISIDQTPVQVTEHRGMLTDRPLLPQLAQCAREAHHQFQADHGADARVEVVGVGTTGLADDDTAEAFVELLSELGVGQVNLAHDSITSYLGALGNQPGVVTAAGTGVVTLAVGSELVHRVDGWGYLVGDAGSGFWLGRAGLDAVMRAYDGRGAATSLTTPVVADFGSLPDLYLQIQADEDRVRRVAGYAKLVDEHAAAGDQVAQDICARGGAELAHSALSGLRVVGASAPAAAVSMLGQVFGSQAVTQSFTDTVLAALPKAEFISPRGSGLDGARLLADVAEDEALFTQIRRARRA